MSKSEWKTEDVQQRRYISKHVGVGVYDIRTRGQRGVGGCDALRGHVEADLDSLGYFGDRSSYHLSLSVWGITRVGLGTPHICPFEDGRMGCVIGAFLTK